MRKATVRALAGFVLLFGLYQAAAYMIVFKNSPAGFLTFQLLFFIGAWAIAKWQSKPGLAAWGLDMKKGLLLHLGLGMVMGLVLYGATFLISLWSGTEKLMEVPPLAAILTPLGLYIFGSFFSSVSEDVLTRGYVYNHLYAKISNGLVVLVSAVIYVLNHLHRLGDGLETLVYLFVLGTLYLIPVLRTKRLWFTGGMHWAGNITFYLTHELWKAEEGAGALSPNYILAGIAILLIPVNYILTSLPGLRSHTQKPASTLSRAKTGCTYSMP